MSSINTLFVDKLPFKMVEAVQVAFESFLAFRKEAIKNPIRVIEDDDKSKN